MHGAELKWPLCRPHTMMRLGLGLGVTDSGEHPEGLFPVGTEEGGTNSGLLQTAKAPLAIHVVHLLLGEAMP